MVRSIPAVQPPVSSAHLISILVLPTLIQDIIHKADKWGNDGRIGRIEPFTEIYDVSRSRSVHFVVGIELASLSLFSL